MLMSGAIAGWTQPISASTLHGCDRVDAVRARRRPGRNPDLQCRRQPRAEPLAALHGRIKQRRGQASLDRHARGARGRRALHLRNENAPADLRERAVLHTRRAGGLAVAAGQAAVRVQLRLAGGLGALEQLLHEVAAATRAVGLVAEQLAGRAGRGAEAAVHALVQDRLSLGAVDAALVFGSEFGLHGQGFGPAQAAAGVRSRVEPAGPSSRLNSRGMRASGRRGLAPPALTVAPFDQLLAGAVQSLRPSAAAPGASDRRHSVAPASNSHAARAPRKNSSRASRRPFQKSAAWLSSMGSPPRRLHAASNAARTHTGSRITDISDHQALAWIGSGLPQTHRVSDWDGE